jgi:hypothetical protein
MNPIVNPFSQQTSVVNNKINFPHHDDAWSNLPYQQQQQQPRDTANVSSFHSDFHLPASQVLAVATVSAASTNNTSLTNANAAALPQLAPPPPIPRKKAKNHRRRHVPVGPAGICFQALQQSSNNNNSTSSTNTKNNKKTASTTTSNRRLEEEEQEEEEQALCSQEDMLRASLAAHDRNDKNNNNNNAAGGAGGEFFSPAWVTMQCQLGFVTPSLPSHSVSFSPLHRYRLLRTHVPCQYLMIIDVLAGKADAWNNHRPVQQQAQQENDDRKMMLLVLVQCIQSRLADHLWTVTLTDETGATIQAWMESATVRKEAEQPERSKFMRTGMVWLLQDITVMLDTTSGSETTSTNSSHDDNAYLDEDHDHNAADASSSLSSSFAGRGIAAAASENRIGRLLLVSERNICRTWAPHQLEQGLTDEQYVEWLEKRNSLQIHQLTPLSSTAPFRIVGDPPSFNEATLGNDNNERRNPKSGLHDNDVDDDDGEFEFDDGEDKNSNPPRRDDSGTCYQQNMKATATTATTTPMPRNSPYCLKESTAAASAPPREQQTLLAILTTTNHQNGSRFNNNPVQTARVCTAISQLTQPQQQQQGRPPLTTNQSHQQLQQQLPSQRQRQEAVGMSALSQQQQLMTPSAGLVIAQQQQRGVVAVATSGATPMHVVAMNRPAQQAHLGATLQVQQQRQIPALLLSPPPAAMNSRSPQQQQQAHSHHSPFNHSSNSDSHCTPRPPPAALQQRDSASLLSTKIGGGGGSVHHDFSQFSAGKNSPKAIRALSRRQNSQSKSRSSNHGESTTSAILSSQDSKQQSQNGHSSSKSKIESSGKNVTTTRPVERTPVSAFAPQGAGVNPLEVFAAKTPPPNKQRPFTSGERRSSDDNHNKRPSRPPLQERQDASTMQKRAYTSGPSNNSDTKRKKKLSPKELNANSGQNDASSTPIDEGSSPAQDESPVVAPTPSKLWTSGVDATMFDLDDDLDLAQEVETLSSGTLLSPKARISAAGGGTRSSDADNSDADTGENDPALYSDGSDDSLFRGKQTLVASLLFNPSAAAGLDLDGFSDDDDD